MEIIFSLEYGGFSDGFKSKISNQLVFLVFNGFLLAKTQNCFFLWEAVFELKTRFGGPCSQHGRHG